MFFLKIYVGQIHVKYVDWIHLFYTQESGILQVNVSELGLVTPAGKVVWGEYSFLHTKYYVFCRFFKLLLCSIFDHTTFGDWESAFGDNFQKLEFTL